MGVHVSRYNGLTKEQYEKSQQIDALLKQERRLNAAVIKLLLLGAAEGGKSTILKQLRILHQDRFNDNELEFQKHIIHNNILSIAISIYNIMCDRSTKFENVDRQEDIRTLIEASKLVKYDNWFNEKVEKALLRLKYDAVFHDCYSKQNEYELPESSRYFFDNLERICTAKYVPSEQDVVRSRVATTGINEIQLVIRNISFRIVDVGGQRSERRKWIHCFSDVDSLIFISSLSEYNLTLAEDMKTNRMNESLTLFGKICNCRWFLNLAIILFLNKRDIFSEKLKTFPLTVGFPDYKGPNTYESTTAFIEEQFQSRKENPNKLVYIHKTCATDPQNVQFVFDACMHIIIGGNLKSTGLT